MWSQYRILRWLDISEEMSFEEYFELFMKNQGTFYPSIRQELCLNVLLSTIICACIMNSCTL